MPTIEERLAALETKLAALTETTPTTYYNHQYSGEEIDAAVGRALTGGAIDQAAGTFVRPNLLDNWYFGRPVNQRGQTEHMGSGYTVDRWTTKEGVVSLTSSGLTLQNMTWLDQIIENPIYNRVYTVSFLTSDGVLFTATGIVNEAASVSTNIDGGGYIYFGYSQDTSRYYVELARADANSPLTVLAAKLELGPTQTLAHRKGDRWVINEVPDYGEQLRRCQRYTFSPLYEAYATAVICNLFVSSVANGVAFGEVTLPVSMRHKPVFSGNASNLWIVAENGGGASRPTAVAVMGLSADKVMIQVNGSYAANTQYILYVENPFTSADFLLFSDL